MKNLFETDIALKKRDDENACVCAKFCEKRVGTDKENRYDEIMNKAMEGLRLSMLPKPMALLMYMLYIIAALLIYSLISTLFKEGFATAFDNVLVVILTAVFTLGAGVMTYFDRRRKKAYKESGAKEDLDKEYEELVNSCYEELGVNPEAPDVDIIESYVMDKRDKNGNRRVNISLITLKIDFDDTAIYLASFNESYKIDKKELTKLEIVNTELKIGDLYLSNEEKLSEKYIKSGISFSATGATFPAFVRLTFTHSSEDYALLAPTYELEKLEEATGLKIDDGEV